MSNETKILASLITIVGLVTVATWARPREPIMPSCVRVCQSTPVEIEPGILADSVIGIGSDTLANGVAYAVKVRGERRDTLIVMTRGASTVVLVQRQRAR